MFGVQSSSDRESGLPKISDREDSATFGGDSKEVLYSDYTFSRFTRGLTMDIVTTSQILGNVGEFVSAIAVVATLAYLAVQVRTAREATEANSVIAREAGQAQLLRGFGDWVQLTTTQPELANILRKTLADWESATPEERERANGWMLAAGLLAEEAEYRWRAKLINEESYKGAIGVTIAIASTPGGRQWWSHARLALGNDISDRIDEELARQPADAPSWTDIFPHLKLDQN
jgi:hypothetical protein